MAGASPDLDGLERLIAILEAQLERLAVLERATGTQTGSLVAQVQAALANINATVQAAISANSYTKAQTDSKVASPGAIAPTTVTASGEVQGSVGRFNGGLYSTDARNFVVQSNYAACWIDINGHFGISPSTRRFKRDITEWDSEDARKIIALAPKKYRLEIPARHVIQLDEDGQVVLDDGNPVITLTYPAFRDPDDAPLRTGFIAEELIDAGLEELVVFDQDGLPASINYAEYTVALQLAVRWLDQQRQQQEERLMTIEQHLGLS